MKTNKTLYRKGKFRGRVVSGQFRLENSLKRLSVAAGKPVSRKPRVFISYEYASAFAKGLADLITLGIAPSRTSRRTSIAEAIARDWTNVGHDLSTAFVKVKSSGSRQA